MFKTVMNKETGEIMSVDVSKDPRRKVRYLHRSGKPFELTPTDAIPSEDPIQDEGTIEQVGTPQDTGEMTLEEVQTKYVQITGKELPARYKNDLNRLLSKINS